MTSAVDSCFEIARFAPCDAGPVMAELEAFISVHTQFPQNVVLDTEHNLDLNPAGWEWGKCLTFPVSELNDLRFSSKPYKWIRFATGIVMGARGDLCTERDLPHPVPIDYDSDLSAVSIDLYYHTSDQEKRRMFPIDPKIADSRTVTSSRTSIRRANFCEVVQARDRRCVATGLRPKYCDAVHLVPHSKGDMVCCTTLPSLTISSVAVYREVHHTPMSRLQWRRRHCMRHR